MPSKSGIDWTPLIVAAGSGLANAVGNHYSKKGDRKAEEEALQKTLDARAASDRQSVAADESKLDPFRHQMSQAGAISKLDRMERGTYKPVSLSAAPGYEKYVPHLFGGASYEKSPELIQSAAALKRNVMGGNGAPTMTDPNNYGKTAVLDLVSLAASGEDPASIGAGGVRPSGAAAVAAPTDYLAGVPQRGGGSGGGVRGAMSGATKGAAIASVVPGVGTAVGAGVGALVGGFSRGQAKSAATDVSVSDASSVLDRVIRAELGRAPNPGEIEAMLAGQGLKPGHQWVGSGGLTFILNTLRSQGQQALTPSFARG